MKRTRHLALALVVGWIFVAGLTQKALSADIDAPGAVTNFAPHASKGTVPFSLARKSGQSLDPAVLEAEARRIAVMERAKHAVLAVFSADGQGGGSGVVISPDGYALTNYHVARPCGIAMKCGMADGRAYDAVLVGLDPTGDVALIKLFGRDDFPAAEMADSDQVSAGDWVFAMGNPFLLATDFQPTVTYGIVSGVNRYQYPAGTLLEYADCIQTDASINPGNSGGPLFDAQGRLIGINGRASFEKRGRVSVGVGYAISINQIKHFLGYLRSGRVVDHATLGARVGRDEEGRVVVDDVLDDSDAYRRGLRYGDEILRFGGRPITTPNGFKNVLGTLPKGWRVPLSFRRDGKRFDVLVRLEGVHGTSELLEKLRGSKKKPPMPLPEPEKKSPEGPAPEAPPTPEPRIHPRKKAPVPEIVQNHFEKRRGYANYFYNRENRQRVWEGWRARADLASRTGTWVLSGRGNGGPVRFELGDRRASATLPAGQWKIELGDELGGALDPPNSGGLLVALSLWRRLAIDGPERFGDVSYLGTAPLVGHEGLVDVLVALRGGVECRFYFAPDDSRLLALEMFPEEGVDPSEIFFSDYRTQDNLSLPRQLEIRFGDQVRETLKLDTLEFGEGTPPDKEGQPR